MRKRVNRADVSEGSDGLERVRHGSKWGMRGAIVALMFGLGVAAWAGLGPDRRARISEAVQSVSERAQAASTSMQGKFDEARAASRKAALEQQVADRIHGEKTLGDERIDVSVLDEGTATLKGLVPDRAAKEKAVVLARNTRGVLRVVDHLAIPPPPRVYAAAAPEPALTEHPRTVR